MATEQPMKLEAESSAEHAPAPAKVEAPEYVDEQEKAVIPPPVEKVDDSKALIVNEKTPDPPVEKTSKGSLDRDITLANLDKEKRSSFIKAWEESEKSKVENKAQKKFSDVASWENTKKAAIEAQLKKLEEKLDNKKAGYAEKMKNKIALIHKQAEEKRAMVEARRGEEKLKAEEMAAKYRATGNAPKKALCCLGV